jgi:flagellar biosynthetic protein FlhB
MADQDADLSEQATPHKLDDARKKGAVAKSTDFTAMAMMAALAMTLYANGWDAVRQALRMEQRILARASRAEWSVDTVATWLGQVLVGMLTLLGPLFLTLAVVAVLVNILQTGPIFSFHPLKPDLQRINPAAGFKRFFSMRIVFETVKSIIKLIVLGAVLYFMVHDAVPGLIGLTAMEPKGYVRMLLGLCGSLLVKLVMALLAIGLLDMLFTRWEFGKRMRMSKRDVRDESKNREGDPRIRARIRQLRQEVLKRSKSVAKVAEADVLITNPTRLVVALSYQHGVSGAPRVVAKGAGELARQMRALAARNQVPIVQNKRLARTLFRQVDYEGYVPEQLYPEVARIMVWVYSMREAKRAAKEAL